MKTTHSNLFNRLGMLAFFAGIAWYLIQMQRYAINAPLAADDLRMFVGHFMEKYLDAEGFLNKLRYFFSETNYPHPRISGRVIGAAYYHLFGEVDYRFLLMCGAITLCSFVIFMRHVTKLDFWLALPIIFIAILPHRMHFWMGPITASPFYLLYAGLTFYGLSKGRIVGPALIAIIASFSHTPGMGIFIAAAPLFLLPINRKPWKILTWLATFAFTVFLFWFIIISNGSVIRVEESRSLTNIVQCVPSLVVYQGQLLALPFFGSEKSAELIRAVPLLGAGLSLAVLFILSFVVFTKRKAFDAKFAMVLALLVFCLFPGPLTALMNDQCSVFDDRVFPRYVMYSMMTWVGIYLFLITSLPKKLQLLTFGVFTAVFLPHYFHHNSMVQKGYEPRAVSWAKRASLVRPQGGKLTNTFGYFQKTLSESIDRKVFVPTFTGFLTADSELPAASEHYENYWYDFRVNKRFCKLEFVVNTDSNDVVEVWNKAAEDKTLNRTVPLKMRVARIRASYPNTKLNFHKTFGPGSKGYIYAAPREDCLDIQIRVGDKTSKTLKVNHEEWVKPKASE